MFALIYDTAHARECEAEEINELHSPPCGEFAPWLAEDDEGNVALCVIHKNELRGLGLVQDPIP